MPTNPPEYDRAYRAARKALGRRVSRGTTRPLEFVAWDGEGETVDAGGGYPSEARWRDACRERAAQLLADRQDTEARYWAALDELGGRIVPGAIDGRRRGEFDDLPRHLRAAPVEGWGNLDLIAQAAGAESGDVLAFFVDHPRRPTWANALAQARDELAAERPRPGVHHYTLLANSRDGPVARGDRLRSREIFDALLAGRERYPHAVHCFFGGSYDATMALLDLPRHEVEALWGAGRRPVTVLRDYAALYRPRRSLFLARWGRPRWVGKRNYAQKSTLWDVWGFFQSSFVTALEKYGFDAGVVADIAAMKARRPTFTARDRAAVERYCVRECELLEQLMVKLAASLEGAGLRPRVWNGAGAVASALLTRGGVKAAIAAPPAYLEDAIARAYFGGRVELCQLGWVQGTCYGKDIASAYPWAATALPDLHADWRPVDGPEPFGCYRVRWRFTAALPWYPLPYRTPAGAILFPAAGEGWFWAPEVAQAQAFAAAYGGRVDVRAGWALSNGPARPFGFVAQVYAQRKQWQREGNGAEKATKIAIAALYGKTAQQLGGTAKDKPPFHSLAWAGYITSATRARLVEAALPDPGAVIAFSTDGIASTRPLAAPDYGDGLGGWESGESIDAVFAQAGVYWLRKPGAWEPKYRGFDREQLATPDAVLEAWCRGDRSIELNCTRFVALGSALTSEECWQARGTWRTVPRRLDLTGASAKRIGVQLRDAKLAPLPVQWNIHYDATRDCSAPYQLAWDTPPLLDGAPEALVEEEADESFA